MSRPFRRPLFIVSALWAAIAGAAIALSLLAAASDKLPGDEPITDGLQDQVFPGQDLSDIDRAVTTTEVVLVVGAAVAVVLWLLGYRQQAILLGAGLASVAIVQTGVKEIVDRPRPDPELVDVRASRTSPSFPAGHVMSGTYLFGFLIYFALTLPLARTVAAVVAVAALAVILLSGLVNVWVGAHWPSDVLGGYLWAGVILLPLIALALDDKANTLRDLS